MRQRNAFWTATGALALSSAALGCASDSDSGNRTSTPVTGSGGVPAGASGAGGTTAASGGTQPAAGGTTIAGSGGMPMNVGGMATGMGGTPGASAGGSIGNGGTNAGAGGAGGDPGAGGAGGDPGAGGAGGDPGASTCVPANSVDADGPFTPTHIQNGGSSGSSWVFYPQDLGRDGMKHPVFNWGPGAGTGPAQYTDHLNRLASHGFVVISQPSSGNGNTEKASLDWLIAENDQPGSTFYQKLDTTKVGAGGHSLGALTTMAMAADPRLNLYVLVCGGCMSGRGGCGAADIHGPTVILGGDTDIGTPNFEGDYAEITSPVVFVTKDGTDHIACARNNLAPWVAFMRWQFCGETQYQPEFEAGGTFCTTPWECKSKGF